MGSLNVWQARGNTAAWVAAAVNAMLTVIKVVVGICAGSRALVADGLHSAADLVSSAVILVALNVSQRPADREHPYGHGKAESLAAKLLALMLFVTAAKIAWDALVAMVQGGGPCPGGVALWVAALSAVTKEGMFRYKMWVGRHLRSPALIASAWEHRSDAWSSVAVLAGITGARWGYAWLDPLASLLVAAFIAKMGWRLGREAIADLMDSLDDPVLLQKLRNVAETVPAVVDVDDLRARRMGRQLLVDIKIGVDPNLSVQAGHAAARQVKEAILQAEPRVIDVMVHVNPHPLRQSLH